MNLIIFGPPGAGKGTQAKRVAKELDLTHVSTGDIFRDNIKKQTPLGKEVSELISKGNLVSDHITNELVKDRLTQKDVKNGFLLDGYPRTVSQANFLDILPGKIDKVINLQVPDEELIKRIAARRICSNCKAEFNLIYNKPKKEGVCDNCHGELIQRKDDNEESVKNRLAVYHKDTQPVIKFYENKGIVINIDGFQPIEKVTSNILGMLE